MTGIISAAKIRNIFLSTVFLYHRINRRLFMELPPPEQGRPNEARKARAVRSPNNEHPLKYIYI